MPTYEYRCQACEHEMEATHSIKDPALVECPVCHAPKLERLISSTSFQLKGSGWYKDLYSSKKGTESKSTDRSEKVQSSINESNAKAAAAAPSSSESTTTKSSEPATKSSGGDKPAA